MGGYGYLWVSGCLWVFMSDMGIYACLCVSVDVYGYLWVSWVCMGSYGCLWVFLGGMGIYGCLWVSVDGYGYL